MVNGRTDISYSKPGDHAIRIPRIKLEEVGMDVDLGRLEVRVIVVVPLAGQQQIDAVIHVGADDGREFQVIISLWSTALLREAHRSGRPCPPWPALSPASWPG